MSEFELYAERVANMTDSKSYDEMSLEELREEAKTREIAGRSGMNKDELIAALEESESGGESTEASPRGTGSAEQDDVTGDSGAVHESSLGDSGVGGLGVKFEGVEQGEAARMEEDAQLANLAPPGAPGPQPPRSAAADPNAKYGQPGE